MKTPFKKTKEVAKSTLKVPIDTSWEECKKAVIKEVAKEYHKEANEIILLASEDDRREFLKYFKEDKGNICCLVLDRIKRDLISEGKLEASDDDAFGKPFML